MAASCAAWAGQVYPVSAGGLTSTRVPERPLRARSRASDSRKSAASAALRATRTWGQARASGANSSSSPPSASTGVPDAKYSSSLTPTKRPGPIVSGKSSRTSEPRISEKARERGTPA